jgi:hypothetical protein
LSVLSCRESRCSPRWDTLLMFSRITPTVSSICCQRRHVSKAVPKVSDDVSGAESREGPCATSKGRGFKLRLPTTDARSLTAEEVVWRQNRKESKTYRLKGSGPGVPAGRSSSSSRRS